MQTLFLKQGITPLGIVHKREQQVKYVFKNITALTGAVKQLEGRRWSQTMNAWQIPGNKAMLERFFSRLALITLPAFGIYN